jgi:hypothetical protein
MLGTVAAAAALGGLGRAARVHVGARAGTRP